MRRQLTRKQMAYLLSLVAKEEKNVRELAAYYEELGRNDRRDRAIVQIVDIDVLRNSLLPFKNGAIIANEESFG